MQAVVMKHTKFLLYAFVCLFGPDYVQNSICHLLLTQEQIKPKDTF